jgi:adenosylcobinamide-phosphate synthase
VWAWLEQFRGVPEYAAILEGPRAAVLIVAVAVDFLAGWFPAVARTLAAPSLAIAAGLSWLESKLNRAHRSAAERGMRGAVVAGLVGVAAAAVGFALADAAERRDDRWVIDGVVLLLFLRGRQIVAEVAPVGRALRNQGADAARSALARAVPRETRELDDHAVARGAIELAAQRYASGLVAPGIWYLVAGLPGLLVYCCASLCAERAAPLHLPPHPFGIVPRALHFVLDFIPAAIAGLFLAAAAIFAPAGNPAQAIRAMSAGSLRLAMQGARWPIAATAGALGLALAGPRRIGGVADATPWIGQGRARATGTDVQRMVYLVMVGWLLFAVALGVLALATTRI